MGKKLNRSIGLILFMYVASRGDSSVARRRKDAHRRRIKTCCSVVFQFRKSADFPAYDSRVEMIASSSLVVEGSKNQLMHLQE